MAVFQFFQQGIADVLLLRLKFYLSYRSIFQLKQDACSLLE